MTEDQIILTYILKRRALDLGLDQPVLNPQQQKQFDQCRRRRAAGEPLQYILGSCDFMGLELAVNPSVLIPRPETEQLVDHALKFCKGDNLSKTQGSVPFKILDLGTGSGNIAIALARFVPQARILSVDISQEALATARDNARLHKVEDRIEFMQEDMEMALRQARQRGDLFDLIISNPPYIPAGQLSSLPLDVQKEPRRALDGGEDGLKFQRIIIKYSPCLLRPEACLMMEFGDGQAQTLLKLAQEEKKFINIEIIKDLAGRERIFKAVVEKDRHGKVHH